MLLWVLVARLFFAIPLPESVELDLIEVDQGLPEARFTFGVGLHLTLAFLGDCSKAELREAGQVASDIEWAPFDLRLSGAGVFPLRGKPKVLWVGTQREPALLHLQNTLTRRLRSADFDLEKRKFHPHVTLARVQRTPEHRLHEWLQRYIAIETEVFRVDRFCLFESTLTQKGPHYTVVDEFRATRPRPRSLGTSHLEADD